MESPSSSYLSCSNLYKSVFRLLFCVCVCVFFFMTPPGASAPLYPRFGVVTLPNFKLLSTAKLQPIYFKLKPLSFHSNVFCVMFFFFCVPPCLNRMITTIFLLPNTCVHEPLAQITSLLNHETPLKWDHVSQPTVFYWHLEH